MNLINKPVVVSVGMGLGQLELINSLWKQGIDVVAFGKGKNSIQAIKKTRFHNEIDTADYMTAIDWIDGLGINVSGVVSCAGGKAISTVQKLSNYYSTPTKLPDFLLDTTDKRIEQDIIKRLGIPYIKTWNLSSLTEKNIDEMEGEFIVKPRNGRGSRDVSIISKEELLSMSKDLSAICKEYLVQEYIFGREYRCLCLVQEGKIKLLAPIYRESFDNTFLLGTLSYLDVDFDVIQSYFLTLINRCGIVNSIMKADIIVDSSNKIYSIEIDFGVGGGEYFKRYVSEVYQISVIDMYISLSLGRRIETSKPKKTNLVMKYVYNTRNKPVSYNIDECKFKIEKMCGNCILLVNRLHPENKCKYTINSDFVFAVIVDKTKMDSDLVLCDYINNNLFIEL